MTSKRSWTRTWAVCTALLACALVTSGCPRKGPAERAGEKIDRGVEKAGDSLEKAGDKIEDATDR
ncbi:MAG: antitoxin [Sandaracinaceae bacterium]|nr:antitoxin [Sandaracinaceae bacterium]